MTQTTTSLSIEQLSANPTLKTVPFMWECDDQSERPGSCGSPHDDSAEPAHAKLKAKTSDLRKARALAAFALIDLDRPGLQLYETVQCIFPMARSTWYEGIKEGIYPSPVRIGKRSVAWTNKSLKELMQRLDGTIAQVTSSEVRKR